MTYASLRPAYPAATPAPWQYENPTGPTYYRGMCKADAIVVHIMQGYSGTAVEWAKGGHYGASWHFTVARDGRVWQHLGLDDGGYHAGIGANKKPTWKLWKGHDFNVNSYTIGIEHEGFSGEPYPKAQQAASAKLVAWLCETLGIPADRDHIIGHNEVDPVDRPNDPGPTWGWNQYLELVEEHMGITEEQMKQIIASELAAHDAARRALEIEVLGSTQLQASEALVARSRAMGRATTLAEVIAANNPEVVP